MAHEQLQRPRLDFLHGVRGLLALTVVLFHLVPSLGIDRSRPVIALLMAPIMHGHLAVPAFLALSGFLLAMPVVLQNERLPGGLLSASIVWLALSHPSIAMAPSRTSKASRHASRQWKSQP